MQDQDRDAIASVFSRIQELERQGHPRDPDAEQLIRQEMQKNPGSAYYLAQTVLVQQQALQNAQARIQELQKNPSAAAQPSGSSPTAASPSTAFGRRAPAAGPAAGGLGTGFGRNNAAPAGGGFMAGALQTAVGVAGGMCWATCSAACSPATRRRPPRLPRQTRVLPRLTRMKAIFRTMAATSRFDTARHD
ncbi:hypothetical protein CAL18_14415 [Bordetella genomosp. 7]|uniref:DUF2076 domain-containing protein n=1 Tax=Bordetella genomosp. 7 TaxID=1416805 RepID=UPI000B9E6025|nr:DUF2076 family protein [Bordetella genomosp. 7]OZI17327.1 hypothetical protein CAL18_14415 [Bordetella genomosp. 7]